MPQNDTAQQLADKAAALIDAGKNNEVINLLPEDVLQNFNDASLYIYRSRAEENSQNADKAFQYINKAIEIGAMNDWAYLIRGNILLDKKEYDKAIDDYTQSAVLNPNYPEAFYNRGRVWYIKKELDKAISDFTQAITLRPDYIFCYNSRGNALLDKGDYDKAIDDYNKAISLKPKYDAAYYNRGLAWYNKKDYKSAIDDYGEAIELNENYTDAYYNRSLAWYDKDEFNNAIDDLNKTIGLNSNFSSAYYLRALSYNQVQNYREAITDFKTYIQLANDPNDYYTQVAQSTIKEIERKIKDDVYSDISDLTFRIKKLLLFDKNCVTHYTGLSAGKAMVLNKSKFRLSEGAFLNDTSEGRELYEFLNFTTVDQQENKTLAEPFAEKPFIGSFVADEKYDDLTLWRMYGKEDKVEAKGCALTIQKDVFLTALKNSLNAIPSNIAIRTEEQFTFFKVAYVTRRADKEFIIPDDEEKSKELTALMQELNAKIVALAPDKKVSVKELLNSIAYLFKSAEYQFENEVRLIVQGVGFDKVIDATSIPPKVFIELVEISPAISKITLGPKVERPDEWAAAFNYQIKKDIPESTVEIVISRLPFK